MARWRPPILAQSARLCPRCSHEAPVFGRMYLLTAMLAPTLLTRLIRDENVAAISVLLLRMLAASMFFGRWTRTLASSASH